MNYKKSIFLFLCIFILSIFLPSASLIANAADKDIPEKLETISDLGKEGKYEQCIILTDQILEKDSTIMKAYYYKSIAYFHLNKPKEALDVLTLQLKLCPKDQMALYNAACACSLLGKNDQAIQYLRQLLLLDIKEKKNIKDDKDFVSLRQLESYKQLMGINVQVGGELLDFDVPPMIIEGRTMLPMRKIFESLGAQITWDDTSKTVTATKGITKVSLTINNKLAKVNGTDKEMEVAPIIVENRTLVPVRFIAESLGAQVNWDADNQVVDILTKANNGTGDNYNLVKEELDKLTVISVVDGAWPDPYNLKVTEGITLIIAKDIKALDLMNSLDNASRIKYMYDSTMDNYGLVIGCKPVHMKFVYVGEVYYAGDMYYDKEQGTQLTYYEKGLPINVVKQYKESWNYKDFYLLPASEQTTSAIGN